MALPNDLNLKTLSLSYQFYDPIMNIVQSMVSEEIRGQVSLKYNYLLQRIRNDENTHFRFDDLFKENVALKNNSRS